MSKLNSILIKAKEGLSPWEPIPEQNWLKIARQLNLEDLPEIQQRIDDLKSELETIPDWDGDTQVELNKAIYFFDELIRLIKVN